MELALRSGVHQSGSLTVAAISAVFTISYVAKLLGEDEDWLHELSISMFPEDGCLHVYDVGEDLDQDHVPDRGPESGVGPPDGRRGNLGFGRGEPFRG